ncbi:MAG: NlpC/P60 family protein [Pseudomonadota bacterium]
MSQDLDRRLNAYRDDLADARLSGRVKAARFIHGTQATIRIPVCDLMRKPDASSGMDTQLKLNDPVTVFDQADGWSWVQAKADNYVGYVPTHAVNLESVVAPTHRVSVPRTFCYREPDLKKRHSAALSLGTSLCVVDKARTRGTDFAQLASGDWVFSNHLTANDKVATDYVSVAESLLATPYLWGGSTAFGIDCSGLVQLSMAMCGKSVLRDSDMLFETVGAHIDPDGGLKRGDLIYWSGHVAIVCDRDNIIHANGHTMMVNVENRADAIERIAYLYSQPTGYKRPA